MTPTETLVAVEVMQWHNKETSPNDYILVRIYSDGTTTASRCVNGSYLPEYELQAFPVEVIRP